MKRKSFDMIVSAVGLFLAVVLLVAGGLLTWAHNFVSDEVHSQLSAQKIYFPPSNSPAVKGPEFAAMRHYGGQKLTTGAQAETYADHFIKVHLNEIGGGKTFAQLSTEAQADPSNAKLAGQVESVFKGETLRGLLLNAYAFGTMATIAGWAALAAFISAAVMLILGALGLWHAGRTPDSDEILTGHHPRGSGSAPAA